MPDELIIFITNYGYLAIFLLVFSQEIGFPNPVPNELVLMFTGYLSFNGILYVPYVIMVAVLADFIGTNILYIVFYFFGTYIFSHKPRWFPVSIHTIEKFKTKISNNKRKYIYIGRLTPFIRGYTSVVCGLLQIKPLTFLPIAFLSASVWSASCVLSGRLFGSSLNYLGSNLGKIKFIFFIAVLIILLIIILLNNKKFIRFFKREKI
ncbi:MAG: DedA family protein [Bacteroidales bacterium]